MIKSKNKNNLLLLLLHFIKQRNIKILRSSPSIRKIILAIENWRKEKKRCFCEWWIISTTVDHNNEYRIKENSKIKLENRDNQFCSNFDELIYKFENKEPFFSSPSPSSFPANRIPGNVRKKHVSPDAFSVGPGLV